MERVRITLVRSPIGHPKQQREVLRTLGLRRINSSVLRQADPVTRGMIKRVNHLVRVEPVAEGEGE